MNLNASRRRRSRPARITDARMRRSRQQLRDAFLALLKRKQLDQITIRDIAAEADVGYATFFRHHASKEELLKEIAAEETARLMGMAMPLLDAADTRVACLALCQYVAEHRAIWTALLTGGAASTLRAEYIRIAKLGAASVRISNWMPVELGVVYGVSAAIEILTWWLRTPEGTHTPEQVAEFLDRLVVTPATAGRKTSAR